MYRSLIKALVVFGCTVLIAAAPAVNGKLENNQLPENDFLGLNRYDLPSFSSSSSDIDIDKTVGQVQQILKLNPQLPKLSKEEILYLLKNITDEDKLKAHDDAETIVGFNIGNGKTKTEEKGTMFVLPYKAEDTSNGDVTELFTKAPLITFEPPIKSKPIVVPDDSSESFDQEDDEKIFENHKYSNEIKSKSSENGNGSKGDKTTNNFWKNQAQKVMEDLEKKNQPKKIPLSIPFKKMPDVDLPVDFNKNNDISNDFDTSDLQSINKLLGEKSNNLEETQSNLAFKPLALYNEFKSLPEPATDFEQIFPKEENEKLIAHQSSSFVGDSPNVQSLYALPSEENSGTKNSEYSISPKLDTSAYLSFKPLPSNGDSKAVDLDKILEEYGIFDSLNSMYLPTNSKDLSNESLKDFTKNTELVEVDTFPASMTSILTDMGLTKDKKKGRKMNGDDEDSYSYDTPKKIDTKYGLDPMKDPELNGLYESLNMIKREMDEKSSEAIVQEVKNGQTTEKTATEKSDSAETSTENQSEEKDKGPSLEALAESFGASPADKDPAEAVLPPPRRNGFYYMVDWNSFLEVGEEGNSRRINIRFEPKLGDPQMFVFGKKDN